MYFWKNPPACLSWYRAFSSASILLPPGNVELIELAIESRSEPAEEGRDLTSDSGISDPRGVLAKEEGLAEEAGLTEEEGLAEDGRTEPPEDVRLKGSINIHVCSTV